DLCDFSGSYLLDPQPQESNQSNNVSNVEPISHIDNAFKIYIIDDTVNKLVMFNMHLRQKGFIDVKQYVLNIPSAYLTVADTDNPSRWHIHIYSELKADKFVNYYLSECNFIAQKIGEGANWANQHIYQPIKPFVNALAPAIVSKGLQAASSGLDAIYANNAQDRIMNLVNFRNDVGNFIDEPRVRESIENNRNIRLNPNVSRNINRSLGPHLTVPSNQTVNDSRYSIQEVSEEYL
ncbi:MAG: hypothetical protein EZS28_013064, partial [Streblomastix strix]